MKSLALALVLLTSVSAGKPKDKPKTANAMKEVVDKLKDMLKDSIDDGKAERKTYAKYKCYCDDTEATKTENIHKLTGEIADQESKLGELRAENKELSMDIAKLKEKIEQNEQDRATAESMRSKENQAFVDEEKDLADAIGQMDEAIDILSEVGGDQTSEGAAADNKQFMAGFKGSLVKLESRVTKALDAAVAFLQPDVKQHIQSLLQAPTYSSQSGRITGILKNMRDTFKTNKANAESTEKKAQEEHDKYIDNKKKTHEKMSDSLSDKETTVSRNSEDISTTDSSLTDNKEEKESDEDILAATRDECAAKEKDYEKRKIMRAGEQAAIAKAIAILDNEAASKNFGTDSFLQIARRNGRVGTIPKDVLNAIANVKSPTQQLVLLRMARSGTKGPFQEVLDQIAAMKKMIKNEELEDFHKWDFCKKKLTKHNETLDDLKAQQVKMADDIAQLDVAIRKANQSITQKQEAMAEIEEDQRSKTEMRHEENLDFEETVETLDASMRTIEKAIIVLKEYYAKIGEHKEFGFVQESGKPKAFDGEYKSQGGTKIIEMLEDVHKTMTEEKSDAQLSERNSKDAFDRIMEELDEEREALTVSIASIRSKKADNENTRLKTIRTTNATEKQQIAIERHVLNLRELQCDFIFANYDKRADARKEELKGVLKAMKDLVASPAYQLSLKSASLE